MNERKDTSTLAGGGRNKRKERQENWSLKQNENVRLTG